MLFEDLTEGVVPEGVPEESPAARMPFLDAYWQDLLTLRQDTEQPAHGQLTSATGENTAPCAEREFTAVS